MIKSCFFFLFKYDFFGHCRSNNIKWMLGNEPTTIKYRFSSRKKVNQTWSPKPFIIDL